jgi:hypothetical protein
MIKKSRICSLSNRSDSRLCTPSVVMLQSIRDLPLFWRARKLNIDLIRNNILLIPETLLQVQRKTKFCRFRTCLFTDYSANNVKRYNLAFSAPPTSKNISTKQVFTFCWTLREACHRMQLTSQNRSSLYSVEYYTVAIVVPFLWRKQDVVSFWWRNDACRVLRGALDTDMQLCNMAGYKWMQCVEGAQILHVRILSIGIMFRQIVYHCGV